MPTDLAVRELPARVDPAELYLSGPARAENSFWLDAGPQARQGWSWLGTGVAVSGPPGDLVCDRASGRTSPMENGGPFRGGWVGWLGYDRAARAAGAPADEDPSLPQALGMQVDRFVAVDHDTGRQWAVAPRADVDDFVAEVATWHGADVTPAVAPPVPVRQRHTPAQYAALIEQCRDAIRRGDAYQLCLTTRFEVPASVDPVTAYLRLRLATPSHHGGLIRVGACALASASPERFLEVGDGMIRTHPIKGTRPRDEDPALDAASAAELRASIKERAENVMIVDLMRNDLQRVCEPGTVTVERLLDVESYPAVHQLVSTVAGRLQPGTRIADVLGATFPAGSMTGAPKLSAMTLLNAFEGAPRGIFAGCFGWIGSDGAADLAMVIRSILTHPGGAYVGAGGGITWRSEASDEVAEVAVKARGPLAALGGRLPSGW